jgi:hypothetical protein
MSDLFTKTSWTGEFFLPDKFDARFTGTLSYSPEEGVVLSYRKSDDTLLPDSSVLHGILDTGEKCSLFGDFSLSFPAWSNINGLTTESGTAGFKLLAVGEFQNEPCMVNSVRFTLSGLQEFFGFRKNSAKLQKAPLQSSRLPFGLLEVWGAGQFDVLSEDISLDIYSENNDAMLCLTEAFAEIKKKFPNTHFMLKKNSKYVMRLTFDDPISIFEAYKHIATISDLFALLRDSPTHSETISSSFKDPANGDVNLTLYPSMGLNNATIELEKRYRPHLQLPISSSNVDITSVLREWVSSPVRESILLPAIQHEIGFRTTHSAHGELVLYTSQLESISYSDGNTERKYAYPLECFGTTRLIGVLERLLSVAGIESIGAAIGDLRNEIAHVGRPKKYLQRLDLGSLMSVARCMQLTIAAKNLTDLGVSADLVKKYVDSLLPR